MIRELTDAKELEQVAGGMIDFSDIRSLFDSLSTGSTSDEPRSSSSTSSRSSSSSSTSSARVSSSSSGERFIELIGNASGGFSFPVS